MQVNKEIPVQMHFETAFGGEFKVLVGKITIRPNTTLKQFWKKALKVFNTAMISADWTPSEMDVKINDAIINVSFDEDNDEKHFFVFKKKILRRRELQQVKMENSTATLYDMSCIIIRSTA